MYTQEIFSVMFEHCDIAFVQTLLNDYEAHL